jgi:hypothetical protein
MTYNIRALRTWSALAFCVISVVANASPQRPAWSGSDYIKPEELLACTTQEAQVNSSSAVGAAPVERPLAPLTSEDISKWQDAVAKRGGSGTGFPFRLAKVSGSFGVAAGSICGGIERPPPPSLPTMLIVLLPSKGGRIGYCESSGLQSCLDAISTDRASLRRIIEGSRIGPWFQAQAPTSLAVMGDALFKPRSRPAPAVAAGPARISTGGLVEASDWLKGANTSAPRCTDLQIVNNTCRPLPVELEPTGWIIWLEDQP